MSNQLAIQALFAAGLIAMVLAVMVKWSNDLTVEMAQKYNYNKEVRHKLSPFLFIGFGVFFIAVALFIHFN